MSEEARERTVLYAEFTALPGNEARVAQLVRGYAELVNAEPGNIVFNAACKQEDPAAFFVYEEYADTDAFSAHLHADYGAAFNASLADLVVGGGSELTFLRPL